MFFQFISNFLSYKCSIPKPHVRNDIFFVHVVYELKIYNRKFEMNWKNIVGVHSCSQGANVWDDYATWLRMSYCLVLPPTDCKGVYELVTFRVKPGMMCQLEHRIEQGLPARLAEDYPPPLGFWHSEFGKANLCK